MPDWLQVLLVLIISLSALAGLVYGGYKFYKHSEKPGQCYFTAFSPTSKATDTPSTYTQVGYITCSSGGSLWKPSKLTVFNQGPGTFYLGPIDGSTSLQEIDAGSTFVFSVSSVYPNVYSTSTTNTPNLVINDI